SIKRRPRKLFLPKSQSKPNPTTVGGRTSGNIMIASRIPFPGNELRAMMRASITPVINTITVAIAAVLKDNHNGDKLTVSINNHLLLLKAVFFQDLLGLISFHIIQKVFCFLLMFCISDNRSRIDNRIMYILINGGEFIYFV